MKIPKPVQAGITAFMKIAALQIAIATTFGVLAFGNSDGQELLDKRISLHVKDRNIRFVLKQIEKQADVTFTYNADLLNEKKVISIVLDSMRIGDVLDRIFQYSIRYEVVRQQIILRPLKRSVLAATESITSTMFIPVSGSVIGENSVPLPGVNVLEKGTTNGTATDASGRFSLSLISENPTLVFSFIGYIPYQTVVQSQSEINVQLESELHSLAEIVVVGYGTQKKSDLTGAISSVEIEQIKKTSARRVEEMLQGRASGVMVTRSEGKPGAASSIHIRGVGSIGNTEPLWIVDGVRMNPGNHLNPSDIESLEILKDASAAAIYGAQAAHGVILVTTKRGSKGDNVHINFRSSVGQRRATDLPQMLNTTQFINASTTSRKNAEQAPEAAWANPGQLPNTNWVDEVFKGSGIEEVYNVDISGGGNNSNFFVSGGYEKENGIMINNSFKRFSFRANSDFTIGKRLTIGQTLYISQSVENPTAGDGRDLENVFRAIPIMPVYDASNPFYGWGRAPTYFQGGNPVATQYQNIINDKWSRINGNVYADVAIIKGLNFRTTFGANIASGREEHFREKFSYGSLTNTINSLSMVSRDMQDFTYNFVLTYQKNIAHHNFSIMGGHEAFKADHVAFGAFAQDFPVQNTRSFALATGSVNVINRTTLGANRLLSQFGRLTYSYRDKYLMTVNVRRDGSSRFGSEFQYGIFPSFSVGYNIGNAEFIKNIPAISSLKVRASWGILGSDNVPDFLFSKTYRNTSSTYAFDPTGVNGGTRDRGFYLRRFPNASVKWEEVNQTDIGIDIALFESKISITADYYIKNTVDMLMPVQLPLSAGISTERQNPENPSINIGEVQNKGIELAIAYNNNVGDFYYTISGNAAFNKNKIVRLVDDNFIASNSFRGFSVSRTQTGYPIGSFFGWKTDGIFQSEQEVLNANNGADGFYQESLTSAGDIKFKDLHGVSGVGPDGRVTAADMTFIGNPWPDLIYGLSLTANYKTVDFTLFLQGVQGVDIYNANKAMYRTVFSDYNSSTRVFESWTQENPTNHPRLIATDPNGNFSKPSDYMVEDGSYLKLRNIQLGYTFRKNTIERIGLNSLRIFANAQNILTLTKYEGLDPELAGDNLARGIDGQGQYPQTRLISGGIQLGF